MKQILLLSAFFFLLNITSASAREISGRVLAENDSTAIPGAMCELRADTAVIAKTMSDSDGRFILSAPGSAQSTLTVTATGYTPAEILMPAGGRDIAAGDIYLSESVQLSDITVTGKSMVDSRGRTIVYPSAAEVKASGTTIDLFQKLPLAGLDANPIQRTLTVDRGTPMILIDGVPATIDEVNSLQPKDIERIEYSRLTPARYADRGTTGMINITLRERADGGSIYAWARSAVATAFIDGNIRASYHQGPSQFSLFYSPSWRNYQDVYDTEVESYIGDDFRVDLDESDRDPFNYFTNRLRLKYDFRPNKRTLFSATFSTGIDSQKNRYIGNTVDSELGTYYNQNISRSKGFTPSLDLFFRYDFNDNNSLEVQAVGTLASIKYRRDNTYDFSDGSAESYLMDVDNRRRSLITEISYSHTFSKSTSFSAGFQNTLSHSRNTYLTSDYKPVLTENNNYVYAKLGQQISKVYLTLSTGAKLFWVKNDLNKRNFIRNLTTVQANWDISPAWSMVGAFQYSPGIPSLSALTDYPQQTTPYLVSNGNPDLKVAEYFTYQLMPSYQYKKFSTSLLLSYQNINNHVISDIIYMGDGKFLSQSVNSRDRQSFSGNLNLKISGIYGFGANANLCLEHYRQAGDGWRHTLTSFNASMTLWWNKGPYTISYWRKFPGKYLSGHHIGKEENGDMLSFGYRPNKHWDIYASWMYMFDVKGTRYPSWSISPVNPSVSDRYIKHNGNMVVLSATYTADFGSIFRTAKRSLNNSDNGSSLLTM